MRFLNNIPKDPGIDHESGNVIALSIRRQRDEFESACRKFKPPSIALYQVKVFCRFSVIIALALVKNEMVGNFRNAIFAAVNKHKQFQHFIQIVGLWHHGSICFISFFQQFIELESLWRR